MVEQMRKPGEFGPYRHRVAMSRPSLALSVRELAEQVGTGRLVEVCIALLAGADRARHVEELRGLTGFGFEPGSPELDPARWEDFWVRTWGPRGLLHVWDDIAGPAVLAGLHDTHWRPVEMCLKVVARHDVAGAGEVVAQLAEHDECARRWPGRWRSSVTPSTPTCYGGC